MVAGGRVRGDEGEDRQDPVGGEQLGDEQAAGVGGGGFGGEAESRRQAVAELVPVVGRPGMPRSASATWRAPARVDLPSSGGR